MSQAQASFQIGKVSAFSTLLAHCGLAISDFNVWHSGFLQRSLKTHSKFAYMGSNVHLVYIISGIEPQYRHDIVSLKLLVNGATYCLLTILFYLNLLM